MNKEVTATVAGGSAGLWLLSTVKWDAITHGELVKLSVALTLIVLGYFFYKGGPGPGPKAEHV